MRSYYYHGSCRPYNPPIPYDSEHTVKYEDKLDDNLEGRIISELNTYDLDSITPLISSDPNQHNVDSILRHILKEIRLKLQVDGYSNSTNELQGNLHALI